MSKIGVVIVTYNPKMDSLKQNVSNFVDGVDEIALVDNSNSPDVESFCLDHKNIVFLGQKSNVGIAEAQNIGIKSLTQSSIDYVLFLDQDSYLTSRQIHEEVKSFKRLEHINSNAALVAPSVGKSMSNKNYIEKEEVISSGSLTSLKVLEDVGVMASELFIDFVDFEWCWRAIKMGYKIVEDTSIELVHQTDDPELVFGKIVSQPFRNYYYYRNIIFLMNQKRVVNNRKWLKRILKHTIFELVFCKQRVLRLKYIIRGINDGKKQRMGKMHKR